MTHAAECISWCHATLAAMHETRCAPNDFDASLRAKRADLAARKDDELREKKQRARPRASVTDDSNVLSLGLDAPTKKLLSKCGV